MQGFPVSGRRKAPSGGGTGVPTGTLADWAGDAATPPAGWLTCDGSAVSRVTYAALFAVVSTTYGVGNGSTTFNLPNFTNRVAVGSEDSYARGATGGEEEHVLTVDELAAHPHDVPSSGSHPHNLEERNLDGGGTTGTRGSVIESDGTTTGAAVWTDRGVYARAKNGGDHIHTASNAGGGQAHNNMPPYLAVPKIIKT